MKKNNQIYNTENKVLQHRNEIIASALSNLFGANVVPQSEYDLINKEKEELLKKTYDINKLKISLLKTECKLRIFVQYHSKWKLTTRSFEQKVRKLNEEKVYVNFKDYPEEVSENLKEAYKCYINGLSMACYIMILRTIEIVVNLIYSQNNTQQLDKNGKPIFISASIKLNWVKANKMVGGADYQVAKSFIEARNDSVHELFVPTEKQILSAFETVINLTVKLKPNISQ
jgi:hypothetical protein